MAGESLGKVLAPNNRRYNCHRDFPGSPYVYAFGHRVYGTVRYVDNVALFTPQGKWAFCINGVATVAQPEVASV